MNYGELKILLARYSHRSDLTDRIPEFIDRAREAINRRFGASIITFVGDPLGDLATNEVLTTWPNLYLFSALKFLSEYENNGDNARYYDQAWERIANSQNITAPGTLSLDPYTDDNPLCITPVQYQEAP